MTRETVYPRYYIYSEEISSFSPYTADAGAFGRKRSFKFYFSVHTVTRAQQLLRWTTVWPQQTWTEKWVGCGAPFRGEGAGSSSNTMSPGPSPSSVPSGILIHPTVWPQYTNVTYRQTGHCCRSIGRTVTGNSHPKKLTTTAWLRQ